MKKKIFTFVALLAMVCGANAKNVYTTTTLWEDTFTDNIAIPVSSLAANDRITVYMTWSGSEGCGLHVFCVTSSWGQEKLNDHDEYPWQGNGTESYSFDLTSADIATMESGSYQSYLYIGTANDSRMTIAKITKTVTSTEEATSTTTIWSGSVAKDAWGTLEDSEMNTASKNVKKGDVFRVTVTNASAGKVMICNASGWATLIENNNVAQDEVQTIELEITDAATLEKIQSNGILVRNTAALTITQVELLTYASSYDCVPATIGSDGIATFSSKKKLDFTTTGVTPYYVSAVATGTVTLTAATNATTWDYCGYILQGEAGTYDVPVTESATYPSATYLKAQVGSGTVAAFSDGKYHYIFAKNNGGVIGFYKLTADHTLAAHKAYLETDTDITPTGAGVKALTLVFDDGQTTAIQHVQEQQPEERAFYNLSGVRVQKPTKGLYIVNGKKVFFK